MSKEKTADIISVIRGLDRKVERNQALDATVKELLDFFYSKCGGESAALFFTSALGQETIKYLLHADGSFESGLTELKRDDISSGKISSDSKNVFAAFSLEENGEAYLVTEHKSKDEKSRAVAAFNSAVDGHTEILSNFLNRLILNTKCKAFTNILDNMSSCVLVCDMNVEKILYANKSMWEMFLEPESMKSNLKKIRSMLSPADNSDETHRSIDFFCEKKNLWFHLCESRINQQYGIAARLITFDDITDKIQYEKTIEKQTLFDSVTGLPNRKQLDLDFQDIIRFAEDDHENGMMLFIDIDNFKIVNDRFGHQYGDMLLHSIGDFLGNLNKFGAQSYAFGGDEFLILIPHLSINNSAKIIDEILGRFNMPWQIDDVSYTTSVSIGTALFPRDGSSLGSLLQKVDMSVYKAKIDGRGRLIEYRESFANKLSRYMDIVREMRSAVMHDFEGFYVSYQPIVSAKTAQTESVEALLRWHHSELGNIGPSEFIPIAEDTGLIIPLGKFVLIEAMTKCKEWYKAGFIHRMNINLSVEQMIRADFISTVTSAVSETGVDPKTIVFEITESIAIKDLVVMNEILSELCKLGFKIALDDFGTGYSSFNCLKDLQLGIVKLDKKFIDNVSKSTLDETVVKSIVNLSHEFNLDVCAEGVEEKDQYNVLRSIGVDLIQGYLFSKPQEAKVLENGFFKSHTPALTS